MVGSGSSEEILYHQSFDFRKNVDSHSFKNKWETFDKKRIFDVVLRVADGTFYTANRR